MQNVFYIKELERTFNFFVFYKFLHGEDNANVKKYSPVNKVRKFS
jgi:hypothetical protein